MVIYWNENRYSMFALSTGISARGRSMICISSQKNSGASMIS